MSETKSTEASIFDSIPDLDIGGSDDTTQSSENTASEPTTEGQSASGTTEGQPAAANTATNTGGEGNPQAAPTVQGIQRRDGLIEVPSKDNPNTRDLVDPATGQVVAAGGRERATWERAQRSHHEARVAQSRASEFERRAITAEAKVAAANEVQQLATQLNVDTAGQKIAVQLYSEFLRDPVSVLTRMVAEVKSKNYNIPFLETGVTPGMDAQALSLMLDQRLAPIMQDRHNTAEQQRVQQAAKETLDSFLASTPDAMHNIGIIGEMLTQEPSLGNNLHAAWAKLIKMSYEAGLDPTQPLGPQYQAKLKAQQQPAQVARTPQTPLPLPNGRQISTPVPIQQAKQFDENSSMSDIIRHSMRESGYPIN